MGSMATMGGVWQCPTHPCLGPSGVVYYDCPSVLDSFLLSFKVMSQRI